MSSYDKDRKILRRIASEYVEIANLDAQKINIANWKAMHSMKPVKPMIILDQIPWGELTANSDYMKIECEDEFAKAIELSLKKKIYQWRFFPGDMVVPPYFELFKSVNNSGNGVQKVNQDESGHEDSETHLFEDNIKDEEALEKMFTPTIKYDKESSEKRKEIVESYFGDILPVKLVGSLIWAAFWDRIVFWRGASTVLYDLIDEPEFLHKIMKKVVDIEQIVVDQYERENLFRVEDALCHCMPVYSDDLPKDGYDPEHILAKDCWISGAAQIFSEVSPAMHDEFEIEYVKPLMERFGAVNYGCCEPLHNKIDIIKKINNIKAISISPWADVRKAAEIMGNDYEMARKPNPAFVGSVSANYDAIRSDLRETIAICRETNTPVALILKDITTVQGDVGRLSRWNEIAKEEIAR